MKSLLKSCIFALALCSVYFTQTATAQSKRFDLDVAAKLVRLSDPNIAPDGKSIVAVVRLCSAAGQRRSGISE